MPSTDPAILREKKQRKYDRRKAWFDQQKAGPCTDCHQFYPTYVMQFDHVRGRKLFGLAHWHLYGRAKVIREIAKCELVCANCHMKRTHQRRSE